MGSATRQRPALASATGSETRRQPALASATGSETRQRPALASPQLPSEPARAASWAKESGCHRQMQDSLTLPAALQISEDERLSVSLVAPFRFRVIW